MNTTQNQTPKNRLRVNASNYDLVCDWITQNTWHYANKNFACSAVDTYEYTGYSVTVPAYQVFEISFTDRYSNAEPIAICISDNADPTTLSGAHMLAESTGKTSTGSSYSDRCVSTLTPKLDYVNNYFVHVKHGGTGNNRVALTYRRIV